MTIFLVLIRPIDQVTLVLIRYLGVIADSDLKDTVDTWNRKNRRIGSCLGQNLYILLVFSQRIPYVIYLSVLIFSSVSITSNYPLEKKMANQISKGGQDSGKGGRMLPPPLNETLNLCIN